MSKRHKISHSACFKPARWNENTRLALEALISENAGKRLPVVFDFDNTLVCGDIGEATLAYLARTGVLTPDNAPEHLCPSFKVPGRGTVNIRNCADVTEYYEAFLAPTPHGNSDKTPLANGYVWAAQIMAGLSVWDVVKATRAAFEWDDPARTGYLEVTPGGSAYPVPVFYPEMVDLVAQLIRHEFDVWVISASNAWSVRWMVARGLNPLLQKLGCASGIPADHVVGVSLLLRDRAGHLLKDSVLVRENRNYANLEPSSLRALRLTSSLQFPPSTYSGKIAAMFDFIGRNSFLAAGDSPGDLPMMMASTHRLWIARTNKASYQQRMAECFRQTDEKSWLFQATIAQPGYGFTPDLFQPPV